jgi:thioredoxin-related protein
MKNTALIIVALIGLSQAFAQNKEIVFEQGTWEEVLAKAKKENKLIFMDAYASWCGPCKWMARTAFKNDTVADFYNAQFINYKLDMEKGQGPELARKYKVNAYPNLLYIDANGELVHRSCGALASQEFIALGKDAKNPEKQFANVQKQYETNKTNSIFLKKYLQTLSTSCLKTEEVATQYFSTLKEQEMLNKDTWEMLMQFANKIESWEFSFVEKNYADYVSRFGQEEVEGLIGKVYSNEMYTALRKKETERYNDLKVRLQKSEYKNAKEITLNMDMEKYFAEEKYEDYAKTALQLLSITQNPNPEMVNSIGWNFYEKVENKDAIEKVIPFLDVACAAEPSYAFFDTYAALLVKSGNPKAKEWINKALEQGKKEGADVSETEKLSGKLK